MKLLKLNLKKISGVWFTTLMDDEMIVASTFSCESRDDVLDRILKFLPIGSSFVEATPVGESLDVLRNMSLIYEGKPAERKFELKVDRFSQFAKKVLLTTYKIPRGYIATYNGIAEAVSNKQAARAVGRIEATNPFAPIVPCHRVIDASLRLHGYGHGLDAKRAFLEREGVVFKENRVSEKCLWNPRLDSEPT